MKSYRKAGWLFARLFALFFLTFGASWANAQAPSHDPTTMIRNTDGRYWIFTTGDGVWAMSSSNPNFTDWQPEPPVFPIGTWPGWIGNYVSGFNGFFWAPEVIYMNGQYYLYYSCAGIGAPAAIGLATAPNLLGPWTDRGLIVAGNNAIDPAILRDGSRLYMTYGNWQTGIDLIQLSTTTGLRSGSSHWDLVPGQVEAPYLIKNGSYYYLFFQRGLCCNGVNSSYYTVVARSTSVTGPYVDKNGVSVSNGGGSVFLPNRDGPYIGPGHVGIGEGKLTYHYYDGNDNGNAKLRVTTLSWVNGWPVADDVTIPQQTVAPGTYSLQNRANGKMLDNYGSTADGAIISQYTDNTSVNQRWVVTYSDGYYKLQCVTGGKFLDTLGNTSDGSTIGQWASSPSFNQQWIFVPMGGGYYKLVNRATGKCLDTEGSSSNGAEMKQYFSNTSPNQQWRFVAP
ncbi:MAG: family 43 glycosylhydrolase [Verrucomicrobiota bacterium JB022]|nr:family 43 glycosylhydrolase [Verrucomicrobiota bacterium JB022]